MNPGEETRRILDMIENGSISAAEGARLLESARPARSAGSMTCPYCAESIPAGSASCPECRSTLDTISNRSADGSGWHSLSGLGRFLALYSILVGTIGLASTLLHGGTMGPWLFSLSGSLLSALGLLAGVLMLKGRSAGWGLGMLWSALQIVTVVVHGEIINQQIFHLGYSYHVNGHGLGINLVGIILLILFIKDKR